MVQSPTVDPNAAAALALYRFGLGPRAGSIAAIAADPRGALLAELDRSGAGRISAPHLASSGAAARTAFAFQQTQRAARREERAVREANARGAGAAGAPRQMAQAPQESTMMKPEEQPAPPRPAAPAPNAPQQIYLDEAKARIDAALGAEIGFAERLVWFWSNHFCV